MWSRPLVCACALVFVVAEAGCGSSGSTGDADGSADGAGSCPSRLPAGSTSCSGSTTCDYGHSTCCGMDYPTVTCKCDMGAFSCSQMTPCNIICPDAGGSDGQSEGGSD